MLKPRFESIPSALKEHHRWVSWGKDKIPFDPRVPNSPANVMDPETWGTFEAARIAYEDGGRNGVGFVLNKDGLVGVDLDGCVAHGTPDPKAIAILDRIGCRYIEISPSGTGLRSFGYSMQENRCKGILDGIKVELYSGGRYLTVTGHVFREGSITALPGFISLSNSLAPTEENRGAQRTTEDDISHPPLSSVVNLDSFLPTEIGQRNIKLFELARYLKGANLNAEVRDVRDVRAYVQEWHRRSLSIIGTKDFGITWADFTRGWEKVHIPYGKTLTDVLDGLSQDYIPDEIQALGYGNQGDEMVRICHRLAKYHGEEPFYISSRKAGELLGIHYTEAAKLLVALVADGVISLVEKGAGKRASRYKWVFPQSPSTLIKKQV